MTLRELLDAAGIAGAAGRSGARRCADRGTFVPQRGRHTGDALFVPGFVVDGHVFLNAVRRQGGRAGVRAAARHRWRRWWCRACARRWGRLPPPSTAGRRRGCGWRGDGDEWQDHNRLPRRQVLEAAGIRTGLLGTVHSVIGGRVEEVERTTPEAVDLQATFARMLEAGDRACR